MEVDKVRVTESAQSCRALGNSVQGPSPRPPGQNLDLPFGNSSPTLPHPTGFMTCKNGCTRRPTSTYSLCSSRRCWHAHRQRRGIRPLTHRGLQRSVLHRKVVDVPHTGGTTCRLVGCW